MSSAPKAGDRPGEAAVAGWSSPATGSREGGAERLPGGPIADDLAASARFRLAGLRAALAAAREAEARAARTCDLIYSLVGEGNAQAQQAQADAIATRRDAGRRRADLEAPVAALERRIAGAAGP